MSLVCELIWGLIAIGAIMPIMPSGGPVALDIVIDFLICAVIAFVDKGLLDQAPFNAIACVFLGFVETLGCMQTSFPAAGQLVAPITLNDIDLIVIFSWDLLATCCLSFVCDKLIEIGVLSKLPASSSDDQKTVE